MPKTNKILFIARAPLNSRAVFLAADDRMSYKGVPHISDLRKSRPQAQLVARRDRFGCAYTARKIRDGLVEKVFREGHRHGVGVLIGQDTWRRICRPVAPCN
jgi:hypothetical protein